MINAASTVAIDYEIVYTACSLAAKPVETRPVLVAYYDTHFERSETGGKHPPERGSCSRFLNGNAVGGVHIIGLNEDDLTRKYRGTLTARVRGRVPETACIGFASYAERRNEFDCACYTNAGTAHVSIGDILDGERRKKPLDRELPLTMETTRLMSEQAIEKGRFRFRVTGVRVGPRVPPFIAADQCILGARGDEIAATLTEFIQQRVEIEGSMPDTWPGIKRVRVPMDISSAGGELTRGCFVPVEGFAIDEPLVVNEGYYANALYRQMRRRNLAIGDFRSLDTAHRAELMAEICTYASQNFDYVSDTVDQSARDRDARYNPMLKIGFEDFHQMGSTGCGDCEDGEKLIQAMYNGFMRLDLKGEAEANVPRPFHEALIDLQAIGRHYVHGLTLATVHGAKADDKTEQIGAHMYGLLLPKRQVREALRFMPYGRDLAERIASVGEEPPLPTLFCEGTGRIRPLGPGPVRVDTVRNMVRSSAALVGQLNPAHPHSFDPLFAERRLLGARMRSKGGGKTEIPHDMGAASNFYLGNLALITDYFMEAGIPLGAFICAQHSGDAPLTRGVQFVDVINQRRSFALVPCLPMPEPVAHITREAVALRAPPRPFLYTGPVGEPLGTTNPDLEWLGKAVAALDRPRGTSPYGSADVFFRPHQFNRHKIEGMYEEISSSWLGAIYAFQYETEAITDSMNTYRLRFFFDHDTATRAIN